MAYEILSESYGRRLPKIAAEADSTDDLATLGTNYAEGSTCVIGDKTYSLDKVQGWVEPGSGGGGVVNIEWVGVGETATTVQTAKELYDACNNGAVLLTGGFTLPAVVDEYYASDEDEEPAGYELTYSYFNFPEAGHNTLTLVVRKFRVEMADAETTGFSGGTGTPYRIEVT